ncbi:MAG: phosphoribosylformylglycinamidine synthase I [Candidatus Aenigmarchaeota archaeon]|nr:phosphoribosylformylglycinamidine synthase I [Candidatus Aenigmarchaeota archaeon]
MNPKVLVLTGYGINCDIETQFAFNLAGGDAKRVHLNDIIHGKESLDDFHILAIPGGFSFGDDIASGRVLANKFKYNLRESVQSFIDEEKLILGICNGFQVMAKLGILPGFDKNYREQQVTLTFNDSGRFEDRWVHLKVNPESKCIFTRGIEKLYLPVRHGEGKFVSKDREIRNRLIQQNHVVVQYVDEDGKFAGYPWNPNGSENNIAGICDETGRIFGMMPHPEAFCHLTNHPRWTREKLEGEGDGLAVFRNAVQWVKEKF